MAASPDPQAALLARGGLPQLTGALANVGQALPDPIDDWLAGIAGDTICGHARGGAGPAERPLARRCAAVLHLGHQRALSVRRGSAIDVNVADFQRLFGPGRLIDTFTNDKPAALCRYDRAALDMARRFWA